MISLDKTDKNLTVPRALGNFPQEGGSGSGITPEEVQEMIDNSISGYDATIQTEFEGVNTSVSANTENIEALSGATSAISQDLAALSAYTESIVIPDMSDYATTATTEGISNNVETLSGITSGISNDLSSLGNDVEALSGVSSAISADLQALSGATEGLAQTLGDKANTSDLEALSAATSGVAVDLETLSAYTAGVQDNDIIYDYAELYNLDQAGKIAAWKAISSYAVSGRKVWINRYITGSAFWYLIYTVSVGTGTHSFYCFTDSKVYSLLFSYNGLFAPSISLSEKYLLPTASSSTLGGVKVGSGLTIDGNGVLSVSGGTGGDSNYVIVDALSSITNPVEGMIAYVPGHPWTSVTECYKLQRDGEGDNGGPSIPNGDNIFRIYLDGAGNYQSYTGDYSWENDGTWHIAKRNAWTGEEYKDFYCRYKTHNDNQDLSNCYFLIDKDYNDNQGLEIRLEGDTTCTEVSDSSARIDVSKFYQYQGGAWQVIAAPDVYYLEDMSQQELVALYNKMLNAYNGGETDFSSWKFYGYNRNINTPFEFRGINDGYVRFASVVARWDDTNALYNRSLSLNSAGTFDEWSSEIRNFDAKQLTVLRERKYLVCDRGTYSGYTIDLSQVPNDTVAVNYDEPSWSWLFKVQKDSEGYYRDGDNNEWSERSTYQLKERFDQRCQYYWKRTGDTMTVIFVKDAPASVSDMNFDASVSYTAITDTADFLYTDNYWYEPNNPEPIYTGNTCSGEWAFDNEIPSIIDGESEPQKKMPVFSFRCASGTTGMKHFAYPIVHYEDVPEVQLYDKDGSGPFTFNKRIYFDYGQYVISILGGQGEYRYAQLTVEAK